MLKKRHGNSKITAAMTTQFKLYLKAGHKDLRKLTKAQLYRAFADPKNPARKWKDGPSKTQFYEFMKGPGPECNVIELMWAHWKQQLRQPAKDDEDFLKQLLRVARDYNQDRIDKLVERFKPSIEKMVESGGDTFKVSKR